MVKVSELKEEYNLFTFKDEIEKEENIKKILKNINEKYGNDIIYINKYKKK